MKNEEAKIIVAAVSVMTMLAALGADVVKSLAGDWRVTGKDLAGVVRLPGTLADAKHQNAKNGIWWANSARVFRVEPRLAQQRGDLQRQFPRARQGAVRD